MNKLAPIKKNNKFYHPHELSHHQPESILFGTIPSFAHAYIKRWFHKKHDASLWIQEYKKLELVSDLSIIWIGHATFLIQTNGITILTDPIFGNLPFLSRMMPPGIALPKLPKIDYVLLSHNHRDHMDAASLKALKKQNHDLQFLVPQGDKAWFDRRGLSGAREFNWWDEHLISRARFVFLPAVHWSQRGMFDKNKSLWGSWMIEGAQRIYFAGDTAHGIHFNHIKQNFAPIDIALMPIGPCEPHDWMRKTHVSGEHSIQAFADLGASHFIPMHWGTFGFGTDEFDAPIKRLHSAWNRMRLNAQLHLLKAGQLFIGAESPIAAPHTVQELLTK